MRPVRVVKDAHVADITYLPVGDGQFHNLVTVLDLYSKHLVGWSIAGRMRTDLVTEALKAAAGARGGNLRGAIFHSGSGARYASKEFARVCNELGVIRSRGAVGTSADNAAADSFNASTKRDTLKDAKRWPGARAAHLAVFRWVTRYNTRRRLSPRPAEPDQLRTAIDRTGHRRVTTGVHDQG